MELISIITQYPVAVAVFLSLLLLLTFLVRYARSRERQKEFRDQTFREPFDLRQLPVKYVVVHEVLDDKMLVQEVYSPKHHPCALYHEGNKRYLNASHIKAPLPADIRKIATVSAIGKQFWVLREAVVSKEVHPRDLLMVGATTITVCDQTKERVWEGNLEFSLS